MLSSGSIGRGLRVRGRKIRDECKEEREVARVRRKSAVVLGFLRLLADT